MNALSRDIVADAGIWAGLPEAEPERWTKKMKIAVAEAAADVNKPAITILAVCKRYNMSGEEFRRWQLLAKDLQPA